MDDDVQARFEAVASRGAPKGADQLWARANAHGSPRRFALQRHPVLSGLAAVLLVSLVVGTLVVLLDGSGPDRHVVQPAAAPDQPSTTAPTATTAEPTTSVPVTTQPAPPAPTGLTVRSVMSPEGIGPLRLGMTMQQAQEAGEISFEPFAKDLPRSPCYNAAPVEKTGIGTDPKQNTVFGFVDDTLQFMWTGNPALSTDRGIHPGSTTEEAVAAYPSAQRETIVQGSRPLVIRDGKGHVLLIVDGTVDGAQGGANADRGVSVLGIIVATESTYRDPSCV
ncbi:MAG: hypothetical protein ABWY80_09980 [Acidimicrobiia bacterium]